ncbi:MAG: hypothetical protein WC768_01775 [Patescibacteria group bacterium]|jgi:hypothetical protein
MANVNRFQDKLGTGKIGTGSAYRAGSWASTKKAGLAGALRQAKLAGKHSFAKNLSEEDLKTFQKLVGEELKQLPKFSGGLSYKARARIMTKARGLMLSGKISQADTDDLRNIVKSLGVGADKPKTAPTESAAESPTQRATKFATDNSENPKGNQSRPGQAIENPHIKAAISLDIAREAKAEETSGQDPLNKYYRPGSILAKNAAGKTANRSPKNTLTIPLTRQNIPTSPKPIGLNDIDFD